MPSKITSTLLKYICETYEYNKKPKNKKSRFFSVFFLNVFFCKKTTRFFDLQHCVWVRACWCLQKKSQVFVMVEVFRRSVWRVAGSIFAIYRVGNTAMKKRRSNGKSLAILCPIWPGEKSKPVSPVLIDRWIDRKQFISLNTNANKTITHTVIQQWSVCSGQEASTNPKVFESRCFLICYLAV